ncbi:MAG: hypothetical protein K0R25_1246 [Rickettsiaceae bacterium]|jgi:hypothetical protein|nr:hypothetical protein [Rickettsiaceae bacterium]
MSSQKHQKINSYLQKIDAHIRQNNELQWQKYVQLGSRAVKLVCYSKDFIPLIEKQLSYTLKDISDNCDATIVLWNEREIENFADAIIDNHVKSRMRLQQLIFKTKDVNFEITDNTNLLVKINAGNGITKHFEILDDSYSKHNPIIKISAVSGIVNAYDRENNIYYYGVKDLHPEEFIKQGHIFVQIFNKIIKTPNSNLVHGAVVGLNNKGILFCARGQRGKSTLAVLSMMQGFDYVSDDYLVLEKEGDELYSYPIYSIITLSPRMYNELYGDLKGKFVSNNARRDKYVIDIKAYHDTFREKYPVKICIFPQIVSDEKPSIILCKKGQAITQLVHSTISQMEDKHDIKTIQKLVSFIRNFEFYQINLCSNISANVECLRQFCNQIN